MTCKRIAWFTPEIFCFHNWYVLLMFGLSYIYKRPILGDNPKPHKILLISVALFTEKRCTFQCFSLKSTVLFMELCFSLKSTVLFIELHFSLKSTVLFIEKHCTFHGVALFTEKHCAFHETVLFTEKHYVFHWKATKTADSTQISHYDLVFDRVQREGQLDTSYILVVFGGACMCIWCMNAHMCFHCVLNWLLSRPFDLILSLCTQLTPFNTIWPNFIIV